VDQQQRQLGDLWGHQAMPNRRRQFSISNVSSHPNQEGECLCRVLGENCSAEERHKLALVYYKSEIKEIKKALQNTKLFQNLVIHDMRNPTS